MIIASGELNGGDAQVVGDEVRCCGNQSANQAVENGLRWLERNFSVHSNPSGAGLRAGQGSWMLYYLYGVERADTLIGVAGLLRGWNAPHKTHIGLLLIRPSGRGQHAGAAVVKQLEAFVRTLPGMTVMRLAVVASNVDAFPFWRKMGFVETGEVKPKSPPYVADVVVMEKLLVSEGSSPK